MVRAETVTRETMSVCRWFHGCGLRVFPFRAPDVEQKLCVCGGSLQIEELASGLSFSSRQSSMESLASLDSRSTLSSRSASSSPAPPRGSPLHQRFRVSAKKALLLWVREQCHK